MKNKIYILAVLFSLLLLPGNSLGDEQCQAQDQIMRFEFSPSTRSFEFVIPGRPAYGPVVPYMGPGGKLHNISPLKDDFFRVKPSWSMNEVSMALGGKVKAVANFWVPPESRWSTSKAMVVEELPKCYVPCGYVFAWAEDSGTTSVDALMGALQAAMIMGGNTFLLVKEGADPLAVSRGWGIGGHTTQGWLWGDGMFGNSAGGGSGYSKNKTGPEGKPHVQGHVLWVPQS